jgi:hypothetical protein
MTRAVRCSRPFFEKMFQNPPRQAGGMDPVQRVLF